MGVVPANKAEVGRFYLSSAWGAGDWLFQCIRTSELHDGEPVKKALIFTIGDKPVLSIKDVPHFNPLIALYDVHVRVDPTSISPSGEASRCKLLVVADVPYLCATTSNHYWTCVDLNEGMVAGSPPHSNTIGFDKWSLVLDDGAGDELTIASFDYSAGSSTSRENFC